MKSTESLFSSNGYKDVDELETDQLRELTTIVKRGRYHQGKHR
jgi:hypothetical protein